MLVADNGGDGSVDICEGGVGGVTITISDCGGDINSNIGVSIQTGS